MLYVPKSLTEARRLKVKSYFTGKPCKRGHIAHRSAKNGTCFKCSNEVKSSPEYRARDRELDKVRREKNGDAYRATSRRYYKNNTVKFMLYNAKLRAAKLGVMFDLTLEDIVIPKYCPALGILLEVAGSLGSAPSIDRIRPQLGYIRGNVAVISHRANTIKSNATPTELRAIADWLERV